MMEYHVDATIYSGVAPGVQTRYKRITLMTQETKSKKITGTRNYSDTKVMTVYSVRRFLTVLFLLAVFGAQAADFMPLQEFALSIKASLSYDELSGTGFLERNGAYVSFAIDQPYIALDWKNFAVVNPPYSKDSVTMVPADFMRAATLHLEGNVPATKERYKVAAILIDPGHGGKDTGAVAENGSYRLLEKDLTLEVSKRVLDLLKGRYSDRRILTTREADTYPSLDDRVSMANSVNLGPSEAVIYVSIHANASFNKNAKGYEVWYLNPDYRRTVVDAQTVKEKGTDIAPILNAMLEEEFTTESIILARKVYERLGSTISKDSPGRGIRAEEWFVVRNAKMPSILIEMGFITNPDEGGKLAGEGYLRRIGDAIYNGIVDFIEHFER
jgi:N-acetylmuramoyl-L-alanine amidase